MEFQNQLFEELHSRWTAKGEMYKIELVNVRHLILSVSRGKPNTLDYKFVNVGLIYSQYSEDHQYEEIEFYIISTSNTDSKEFFRPKYTEVWTSTTRNEDYTIETLADYIIDKAESLIEQVVFS